MWLCDCRNTDAAASPALEAWLVHARQQERAQVSAHYESLIGQLNAQFIHGLQSLRADDEAQLLAERAAHAAQLQQFESEYAEALLQTQQRYELEMGALRDKFEGT
jgi:hypothetical protein